MSRQANFVVLTKFRKANWWVCLAKSSVCHTDSRCFRRFFTGSDSVSVSSVRPGLLDLSRCRFRVLKRRANRCRSESSLRLEHSILAPYMSKKACSNETRKPVGMLCVKHREERSGTKRVLCYVHEPRKVLLSSRCTARFLPWCCTSQVTILCLFCANA